MKKVRKKKLIHKLLLFTLPLLISSIGITAAVLSWNNYDYFLHTIDRDYRNIIMSSGNEIEIYLQNARESVERLARVLNATRLDPWRQEIALKAFNQQALSCMSIRLLTVTGRLVASSGWPGKDVDLDYKGDGLWQRVIDGETVLSDILYTKDSIPYVCLGLPVLRLGKVDTILWGELSLKAIWDVIERITIGRTGQVYIMNLSGQVIVDRSIVPVSNNPPRPTSITLETLAGPDKTPFAWTEKRGDVQYYCLGYTIRSLGWVIVLSQTDEETYAYLYRNMRSAAVITLLVCLVTILFGWYLVRDFIQPIHLLHYQVQKIGRGDLSQKVDLRSEDEIGDLSREFNKMTDSLKDFIRREVEVAKELVHARNLAVLGTASAKVTHEVGNLLNNMELSVAMLRQEKLSTNAERSIQALENESERVTEFIQNFLQFAKKPELNIRLVPIGAIIEEILFVIRPQAEERGIMIRLSWAPDLPPVHADARLIYQVVNNLVKNSLEAMTGEGEISIGGKVEADWLKVIVTDTGAGVLPGDLDRIFEPFFTTKGKKGTGLGLSICKSIMEAHRGAIECASELSGGTTFALKLPIR